MIKVAIDIGNTDVVFGFNVENEWRSIFRVKSDLSKNAEEFEKNIRAFLLEEDIFTADISSIIVSSVVPELTGRITQAAHSVLGMNPKVVNGELLSQLNLGKINPYELGSDLAANAMGAYSRYKKSVIVVDFGTALTFTSTNEKGHIMGVAIAPGVRTAMKSLSSNTAKLPEIPLEIPVNVIGTNTVEALQAGIMQGYVGMVTHMIELTKKELNSNPKVIATGGLSFIFEPLHYLFDDIDVNLTLDGLLVMADKSKGVE